MNNFSTKHKSKSSIENLGFRLPAKNLSIFSCALDPWSDTEKLFLILLHSLLTGKPNSSSEYGVRFLSGLLRHLQAFDNGQTLLRIIKSRTKPIQQSESNTTPKLSRSTQTLDGFTTSGKVRFSSTNNFSCHYSDFYSSKENRNIGSGHFHLFGGCQRIIRINKCSLKMSDVLLWNALYVLLKKITLVHCLWPIILDKFKLGNCLATDSTKNNTTKINKHYQITIRDFFPYFPNLMCSGDNQSSLKTSTNVENIAAHTHDPLPFNSKIGIFRGIVFSIWFCLVGEHGLLVYYVLFYVLLKDTNNNLLDSYLIFHTSIPSSCFLVRILQHGSLESFSLHARFTKMEKRKGILYHEIHVLCDDTKEQTKTASQFHQAIHATPINCPILNSTNEMMNKPKDSISQTSNIDTRYFYLSSDHYTHDLNLFNILDTTLIIHITLWFCMTASVSGARYIYSFGSYDEMDGKGTRAETG